MQIKSKSIELPEKDSKQVYEQQKGNLDRAWDGFMKNCKIGTCKNPAWAKFVSLRELPPPDRHKFIRDFGENMCDVHGVRIAMLQVHLSKQVVEI